jgi:23S rRNA A1618 N6-methylase RlmF
MSRVLDEDWYRSLTHQEIIALAEINFSHGRKKSSRRVTAWSELQPDAQRRWIEKTRNLFRQAIGVTADHAHPNTTFESRG